MKAFLKITAVIAAAITALYLNNVPDTAASNNAVAEELPHCFSAGQRERGHMLTLNTAGDFIEVACK